MDMYIRVKRSKTTYFIRCKPSDKVLDIKQKLQELVDQPANNQQLILPGTGEVLEDSKTLADQKVENDAVVALTLRKDDNEFEEVNIVQPNDFYQARDGDGGNWWHDEIHNVPEDIFKPLINCRVNDVLVWTILNLLS
ncbi:hypothetical protein VNO78_03033 [Psophocarpus tetragonolobus]|uniref:Ubiquitin-like domain-containing protein n=1 Tax=Psophocarpus tetragonolobus TaxID=3891 RepID=A0AAN9T3L0_PSOTE